MKSNASIIILFTMLVSAFYSSSAQAQKAPESANIVKINITSIPLSNLNFQYERALTKRISGLLGLRIMPSSNLPFSSTIESLLDDEESWRYLKNLKLSNFAITPEVRFYLGKNSLRGFYLAPYARLARFSVKTPFEFDYTELTNDPEEQEIISDYITSSTIPLEGSFTTFSGGLLMGAQFRIAKMVYLDWWILGAHYGNSKGDLQGEMNLSALEQQALRENLDILYDLPIVDNYEVNENGANISIKGPSVGVRAGVSLGLRF